MTRNLLPTPLPLPQRTMAAASPPPATTAAMTTLPPSDALPADDSLEAKPHLVVLTPDGQPTPLTDLTSSASAARVLLVFIRHFYCGSCKDFVRALAAEPSLSPQSLLSTNPGTALCIVGCGQPSLIPAYRAELGAPWEFYSDPSGVVYDALGMHRSLASGPGTGGGKPEYIKTGFARLAWNGIVDSVKGGPTKGGDVTRVRSHTPLAYNKSAAYSPARATGWRRVPLGRWQAGLVSPHEAYSRPSGGGTNCQTFAGLAQPEMRAQS